MKNRKARSGKLKGDNYPARKPWYWPYKSGLEHKIANGPLKDWKYEATKLKFVQPAKDRTYTPDYTSPDETIYIEAKGRISNLDELLKVVWCREQYPDKTFVWVLQNPNGRAYPQSKQRLGDWLTKNGFKWISVSDLEDRTIEELLDNDR